MNKDGDQSQSKMFQYENQKKDYLIKQLQNDFSDITNLKNNWGRGVAAHIFMCQKTKKK